MNQKSVSTLRLLCSSTVAFSLATASGQNSDGYWSAGGSGSWANANNWDSSTIADGTDNTAYFGLTPLEPAIPASATFTLDGARTIGNVYFTASSGPDNWLVSAGSGGPLTLANDIDYPGITVNLANQQVTVSVVLAGITGLEKLGAGTLILAATNTYTGGTIVTGGTLLVNGAITDTGALTNLSGALGGAGMIAGPLVVQSGAALAPGNSGIGALTINNTLTLQAGSKTLIEVNAATLAHDVVQGLSSASYGGTLVVSNLAGTPSPGQSFQLFSTASAGGNFSSLTPQLTNGMRWRFDAASGVLSVVSTVSEPQISSVSRSGANLVLTVINGAPGVTNYLLAATNLTLPLANWTRLATNVFDVSGADAFTNTVNPSAFAAFFAVALNGP